MAAQVLVKLGADLNRVREPSAVIEHARPDGRSLPRYERLAVY